MPKDTFTDTEVEIEIARLTENEQVKLAREELKIKNRRRPST